ncbi:unnamed protein product [Nezara viridula]|uniref:MORN repeat-containing protein 3 n=1 Tax=Nezara viridula TaxID=85310 RepID=A0A9P0MKE2_NEZVI|nr:unnamed protein product [Nezara viridula]
MPPENVRYPPSHHARNYIKTALQKCYNTKPKLLEIKEAKSLKNGHRRFCSTKTGLYRGWWKNNLRDGVGVQVNNVTRITLEGEFKADICSGYGILSRTKPNGLKTLVYDGDFFNGAPNGKGELHTDNYFYSGKLYNGKASGVGIAWFNNGTIYFGNWYNGKRMGQGMLINGNKDRYEGNWYDDKKHGYGKYCFFDRGQALEGVWVADVCVRGTMRNIKYRQAAMNPVKYSIPMLMLKDWITSYYFWEQEAFARVGKYIKDDLGIKDVNLEDFETSSAELQPYDMKQNLAGNFLSVEINTDSNTSLKLPSTTKIEPCVR